MFQSLIEALLPIIPFSPHTRGCSFHKILLHNQNSVFPAYAGMFLGVPSGAAKSARFPRIRGDVPFIVSSTCLIIGFSPHTRGCSADEAACGMVDRVFPAYAGMFRNAGGSRIPRSRFPRIRGDVPPATPTVGQNTKFSPHTRGCSSAANISAKVAAVFPAYAGMFRSCHSRRNFRKSFPRIRGDVPKNCCMKPVRCLFSPHTRGCSAQI